VAFTLITVTHDYTNDEDVAPPSGALIVQYSDMLVNGSDSRSIAEIVVPLVAGVFSAELPATDDPATTPQGASVSFLERIAGYPPKLYSVVLSASLAPTVDLATLLPQVIGTPLTDYSSTPVAGTGSFFFQQIESLQIWNVAHFLGRNPFVVAYDSKGRGLAATVTFIDDDNLTIAFPISVSGTATLT